MKYRISQPQQEKLGKSTYMTGIKRRANKAEVMEGVETCSLSMAV